MRRWLWILALILTGYGLGAYVTAWDAQAKTIKPVEPVTLTKSSNSQAQLKVLFSPVDDVQTEIVRTLNSAKKQILVQAYLLTDDKITHALIAAHQRHVEVKVLLDAERTTQASGSDAAQLEKAGIVVKLENIYENAHNKVIVIDAGTSNAVLITGSYNFTYTAAKKNAENILFIRNSPDIVNQYVNNWQVHEKQAISFKTYP